MTVEELRVLVTAETSELRASIKDVRKQLANMNTDTSKQMKNLDRTIAKTSQSMTNSFKNMIKPLTKILSLAAFTKLASDAVQLASDLEEVENVVRVSFGNLSEEVEAFAKIAMTSFGLSELAAKKMASTFMAMSNGMGVATQTGKTMALQLTALAGDMASFYNVTEEVAQTALQSVYTGETESLKKFGVVMTEANLKAYALAHGIKKSYNELSQAEKVMLRYNYVMQATSKAQGDFARTSGSWANQVRLLKQRWLELTAVLGGLFTQILLPIVKALNVILSQVISIANAVSKAFGKEGIQVVSDDAQSNVANVGSSIDGVAGSLDEANSNAKALSKTLAGFDELNVMSSSAAGAGALGAVGGGADMSLLTPYDFETTGAEENKSMQEMVNSFNQYVSQLDAKIDEYNSKVKEWAHSLGEGINNLFDYIDWEELGDTIGSGVSLVFVALEEVVNTVDWVGAGKDIGDMIVSGLKNTDFYTVGKFLIEQIMIIPEMIVGIVSAEGFWESVSNAILEGLRGAISQAEGVGNLIAEMINNIDWAVVAETILKGLALVGAGIAELVKGFLSEADWDTLLIVGITIGGLIAKGILTEINKLGMSLSSLLSSGGFKAFREGLEKLFAVGGLSGAKGVILEWVADFTKVLDGTKTPMQFFQVTMTNINRLLAIPAVKIGLIVAAIALLIGIMTQLYQNCEGFRVMIDNLWNNVIKPFLDMAGKLLSDLWTGTIQPLFESLWPVIEKLIEFIGKILAVLAFLVGYIVSTVAPLIAGAFQVILEAIAFVIDAALGVIQGFVDAVSGQLDAFIQILNGIIQFLCGVFSGNFESAWQGIVNILKGIWNLIVSTIEGGINLIISGINGLIKGFNKLTALGKAIGVNFSIPLLARVKLPRLAKGGVLTSPTVAMMGEYAGASNNPEIVTPQRLLETIIDKGNEEVVSALAQMTRQLITAIGDVDMSVSIGDNVIAQSAARGNQAYKKRTGVALI